MRIVSLYTNNNDFYKVGADRITTPEGDVMLDYEIAEINAVFFTTAREDWFAILDSEGKIRKMINPRNVVDVDIE